MNFESYFTQRMQHLPPPITRNILIERDLKVPMRDGAVLLADRWIPANGGDGLPTVLVRIPYGRTGLVAKQTIRPLAERGFQVLVQSTRGTFGSDGPFDPLRREREDGLDTLDWVIKQPWFGESIVLVGSSYLGFVQWAVADKLPPQVKAIIPAVTESALTREFLRGDGFSLEVLFNWSVQMDGQERKHATVRQLLAANKVQQAQWTLPLRDIDKVAIGHHSDYFQNVLAHNADDPFWAPLDHRKMVADVTVPASLIGGWYDVFLPGMIRDFKVLQTNGRTARLTIGPWAHDAVFNVGEVAAREALDFGLAFAKGEQPQKRAAVRLYVMGHDEGWRDFQAWPPDIYKAQRFYLQSNGSLAADLPGESTPDSYKYDPSNPTPAVGGVRLAPGIKAGRADNTKLEARSDVLTYSTPALERDTEIIGEISADIWFKSSLPYADVFVRLCDFDEKGLSTNICDGLISLTGADQISCATVSLWPTAYRFKRGHRIRVQISSGAFPRYNRNLGTGEQRASATAMHVAQQQVFHDREHPSAIVLPVRQSE